MARAGETEVVPAWREVCFFVTFLDFDRHYLWRKSHAIFLPKINHPGPDRELAPDDKNNDENCNTGARARDLGFVTFGNTSEVLRRKAPFGF